MSAPPSALRRLLKSSAALRSVYPEFSLEQEMQDPGFRSLVSGGVSMRAAYELSHRREILQSAMDYAVRRSQKALVSTLRAQGLRPRENAAGGNSAVWEAPKDLSPAQRKDLRRRVALGEKVSF